MLNTYKKKNNQTFHTFKSKNYWCGTFQPCTHIIFLVKKPIVVRVLSY